MNMLSPIIFERETLTPSPLTSTSSVESYAGERGKTRAHRGFTLIEVLASLVLLSIVLPVAMQGISLASRAASLATRRAEAGSLADSKLAELVATGEWQSGSVSGDFGEDWKDYTWSAEVQGWTQANVQELDIHVTWAGRGGQPESVNISSLVYVAGSSDGTTDDTTGSTTGSQP